MRYLQGPNETTEIKRFGALPVRVGVAGLEEGRDGDGKNNRVLYTEQLPKKGEMGFP